AEVNDVGAAAPLEGRREDRVVLGVQVGRELDVYVRVLLVERLDELLVGRHVLCTPAPERQRRLRQGAGGERQGRHGCEQSDPAHVWTSHRCGSAVGPRPTGGQGLVKRSESTNAVPLGQRQSLHAMTTWPGDVR